MLSLAFLRADLDDGDMVRGKPGQPLISTAKSTGFPLLTGERSIGQAETMTATGRKASNVTESPGPDFVGSRSNRPSLVQGMLMKRLNESGTY